MRRPLRRPAGFAFDGGPPLAAFGSIPCRLPPNKHRCAVLDDYQDVALKMADWSGLADEVDVTVFNRPLGEPPRRSRGRCRASPSSC